MATLYRTTDYTLGHLVSDISIGRIGLPDIQRPFVWSRAKIRDLLDSMYRGYPVGTLMLWETGADIYTRQIGTNEVPDAPRSLVVDGQQRLTSLYAVQTGAPILTGKYVEETIRIAFNPSEERFAVTDAAIERDPEYIADITTLWQQGYKARVREFLTGLKESSGHELTTEMEDQLEERIDRVRELREFSFHVIELSAEADEEEVAEIFVRINSEGVKLNQADFILTLMSVHWEKGRRQLEAFARAAVESKPGVTSPKNPIADPAPDQLLRTAVALAFRRARLTHVYSILRGKDLRTKDVSTERRAEQFERLAVAQEKVLDLTSWHEYLKCLQTAGFRSKKMITSETTVFYCYALWMIGRHDFGLDTTTLRQAIARWFFMSQLTSRYTGSTESAFEADLGRIDILPEGDGEAFLAELDRIIASTLTSDFWGITLPDALDTSASRSPALSSYQAALDVLDAEVLFSDVRVRDLLDPAVTAPRSIERHHLFPKQYLASIGISNIKQTNAIANMAFVDWSDNAKISDTAPLEYWPVMTAQLAPGQLERQKHLHALPIGWEQLDYDEFLAKRRPLISAVIREGFQQLSEGRNTEVPDFDVEQLIASGESQRLEFKSSTKVAVTTGEADPRLEMVIVKAVCGLLNAEGGSLLIGVADDGGVLGLERDIKALGRKQNLDGYELMLRELLERNLSTSTAATVRIAFPEVHGETICHVKVAAAGRPVFCNSVKQKGLEPTDFYVRMGNQTRQLHGEEADDYKRDHWG